MRRRQALELRRETAFSGEENAGPFVFPGLGQPPEVLKLPLEGVSYARLQFRNQGSFVRPFMRHDRILLKAVDV
jgi:hypothetical protein